MVVNHNIIKLQISMRQTHTVQIQDTTEDLQSAAGNFVARHFACHDNREQVERSILHNLKPVALLMDDVDRLDDVAVMKGRTDTELSCNLLVVFPLTFVCVTGAELLDGKSLAISSSLHESDRPTGARAKNSSELAIFGS